MTRDPSHGIYQRLRQDLIEGQFVAGQKLMIDALRQRYGVGLSPLREALNRLAATGLLEQSHQRGFRVPGLSREVLDDVTALRREIEGRALDISIANGDSEWEVLVSSALFRLRQAKTMFNTEAHTEWERRHAAFHRALIAGCSSAWRLRFVDQLYDQFDCYRRRASISRRRLEKLDDQHEQLAEHALARNAGQAVALLDSHIMLSWEVAAGCCAPATD